MADRDGLESSDPPADPARRGAVGVPAEATVDHAPTEPAGDESTDPDLPRIVTLAGRAGVGLAVGSLGLAVLGVAGFALDVQPYAAILTVLALAGVTLAMALGMAYQAFAGDWLAE